MKKYMVLCAGLCVAFAFTSCKSSESAYRKAYEKAKAQEQSNIDTQNQGDENIAVVTPVVEKPVTETVVVDNADNVPVRQETLSVVNGAGLKNFSVVVGSFSVRANAEGLQSTLKSRGYDAQVAFNSSNQMYRVVAATYDVKTDAVRSRNELRSQYPDAWLLFNQK
ncbi:MAG: SPOR domain-containing protein [Prevotellaceae bacterium]|nr:SPOR domain-containing protein [Prevotellaceae bacterium]